MMRTSKFGVDASCPLGRYLDATRVDPLLTADDERHLAEAIAQGDSGARARMIRANLRLVVRIARDYLGRGLSLDDLVGEGNLGLIRATEEFDPKFQTRFSTYASYWIKQAIRQALINTTATIRLPAHMVGLLTRWRRTERALRRELGYDPSPDRIADDLGLSAMQRTMVERALRARKLRLDTDRSRDEEDSGWATDEAMDSQGPPELEIEAAEARDEVRRRLTRLDDRERTIVSLRFGLDGHDPMTLKEIGRRLGVTREWVRKIELRAVRKLDDRQGEPALAGSGRARTA
ncbi:MAG: sigA 6 [Planctomycetota bacterium]|nr:sigA 6 [Planctomycetota bacterium]